MTAQLKEWWLYATILTGIGFALTFTWSTQVPWYMWVWFAAWAPTMSRFVWLAIRGEE